VELPGTRICRPAKISKNEIKKQDVLENLPPADLPQDLIQNPKPNKK
jgi:hypothetical protein